MRREKGRTPFCLDDVVFTPSSGNLAIRLGSDRASHSFCMEHSTQTLPLNLNVFRHFQALVSIARLEED